jgi:hypothetical protein
MGALQKLGIQVEDERIIPERGNGRPRVVADLVATFGGKTYIIDVTVGEPTGITAMRNGAKSHPLRHAETLERQKLNKYRAVMERLRRMSNEFIMVPIAVETYGGYGAHTTQFLSKVATYASRAPIHHCRQCWL